MYLPVFAKVNGGIAVRTIPVGRDRFSLPGIGTSCRPTGRDSCFPASLAQFRATEFKNRTAGDSGRAPVLPGNFHHVDDPPGEAVDGILGRRRQRLADFGGHFRLSD